MKMRQLSVLMSHLSDDFYDFWHRKSAKYAYHIGAAVLAILAGIGIFFAYRWHAAKREEKAFQDLATYSAQYRAAQQETAPDWQQLVQLFQAGYEQHKTARLAPYFLVFKAEILSKEGKHEDALAQLTAAVDSLSNSDTLKPLFRTKRALMLLDSADDGNRLYGIEELKLLSDKNSNAQYDVAQFYYGLYYWAQNDLEQARAIWQSLIDSQQGEQLAPSPWAELAAQKLHQLVA